MEEVWKDIPGYEGFYQASNLGKIKSLDRNVKVKNGTWHRKGSEMKIRLDRGGYERVCLSKNSKSNLRLVHRLVLAAFNGVSDMTVNHIDGIKTNNKLENLEYCTSKENTNHAVGIGLIKNNALSNSREIIKDFESGLKFRDLTKKYKTSYDSIKKVLVENGFEMKADRNKTKVLVDVDEMARLYSSGYNKSEIAKKMNVSRDVVYYRLKQVSGRMT